MFTFHEEDKVMGDGIVLAITLPGAIASEYQSRLHMQHCDFASDIVWGEENLCATVHSMSLNLAQFLIKNKDVFNVESVVIVSSKDIDLAEISLLDGFHKEPLEYLALLDGSEDQSEASGESQDGDNDSAED